MVQITNSCAKLTELSYDRNSGLLLNTKNDFFLLRNDWLNKAKATIDFQNENLIMKYKRHQAKISISFISEYEYREEKQEEEYDSKDEVEYLQSTNIPIYFSEMSEGKSDFQDSPTYILNILYNNKSIFLLQRNDPRKMMYKQWQFSRGKIKKMKL